MTQNEHFYVFGSGGGCAQNTLRVFQWFTGKVHEAFMIGSVGNDETGSLLKSLMEADGVKTEYIQQDVPTGATVCLVHGSQASLVANVGAAEHFKVEQIRRTNIRSTMYDADLAYIEGFFLTNREEAARYLLDCCNTMKLMVAFNICGVYVCDMVPDTLQYFVENCDIIFGNKVEFEAVAKLMKFSTVKELIQKILKNNKYKLEKAHGNIVVITDGANPGQCHHGEGQYFEFHVMDVEKDQFKDTIGAGDAFVAGFLAGLLQKKSLDWCATLGCYTANEVIRETGCTLPKRPPVFDIDDVH
uniref:Adenosine kinase n=1 Tax=Diabrotica virgifera virgifera TaxID=50390 RepID=A0A6P7F214_DIAVI